MSGQDATGADSQRLEALARQVGDLERQAAELGAAIQRSATVRRLLLLVVVALLAVYGFLYYTTGRSFADQKNLDELMVQLRLRASANSDTVIRHAQVLVEHTWPTVSQAINEQFKKDMPAIMNQLGTERENLAVNLRDRLDSHVRGQYKEALGQHRVILQEEFPSIKDDEAISAMIGNFETAFEPLVKTYYGNKLAAQFEVMYKTWDDFPLDDSRRNREKLADDLYLLLFELMKTKLARGAGEAEGVGAASRAGGA